VNNDGDANCPFCQKLAGLDLLPADEVVWQFPHSVALLGPWQYYQGYCILIARTHATELFHLDQGVRRAYLDEMTTLARAVADCFGPRKVNYELLGNQVPHLHWHVLPRYAEDPEVLKPVWLALDRGERDEQEKRRLAAGRLERHAIAEQIRTGLSRVLANAAT
jgi:diadenosine tetraphosphate (Ap4A) HIT family hydrolase